jgi:hypothetical protein
LLKGAGNDGDRSLRRLSLRRLRLCSAAPKQLLENIAEAREIGLCFWKVVLRYAGHFSYSAFAARCRDDGHILSEKLGDC